MRGFLRDLTYSLRLARKSPGFTSLAVVCLALGIGVNTSVFSMLNFLFFRPLPVEARDRLVVLGRDGNQLISWPEYRDLRDRTRLLTGMAAAEAVSIDYPRVIGVRPSWAAGSRMKTSRPPWPANFRSPKSHPGPTA